MTEKLRLKLSQREQLMGRRMKKSEFLATTSMTSSSGSSPFAGNPPRRITEHSVSETAVASSNQKLNTELGISEKGIIVSNPMKVTGTSIQIGSSELDETELKRSLLFWDKIVWPSTSGIFFPGSDDVRFLQQEGQLIRPHYQINGDVAEGLSRSFLETYIRLEEQAPGAWILSNAGQSLGMFKDEVATNRGIVAELMNAVPVPSRDMPIEDILRFKSSRKSEVIALRSAIDGFYQGWLNSEDQDHQFWLALSKIDEASKDMVRVARESKSSFSLSSWKLSFSFTAKEIFEAAVKVSGASYIGLDLVQSLIIGATSSISFSKDVGFKSASTNSAFNYVASMEKELI